MLKGEGGGGVSRGKLYICLDGGIGWQGVCRGYGYVLTELGTFVWSIVYFFISKSMWALLDIIVPFIPWFWLSIQGTITAGCRKGMELIRRGIVFQWRFRLDPKINNAKVLTSEIKLYVEYRVILNAQSLFPMRALWNLGPMLYLNIKLSF